MSQRVDFSANAANYDRRHGSVLPEETARSLAAAATLGSNDSILDIGAGTGRVASAFLGLGYPVVAVEPAVSMAEAFRTKTVALPTRVVRGEGERLPFRSSIVDAVVIARLLYLAVDWPTILREAHRVLKPGGRLLHEWGNGHAAEAWAQIREKARALFEDAGIVAPFHPGARSEEQIDQHLTTLGFVTRSKVVVGPGPSLTLRDFLNRIVSGEFSYIWAVPTDVQEACLPALRAWSEATFDLEQLVPMPEQLEWTIFQKDAVQQAFAAGSGQRDNEPAAAETRSLAR